MVAQINVMSAPYSATGNCSTDDHNAIMAAQTAAMACAAGNTTPCVLYFPKPPGGCYLTSTITWRGVSIVGQQSGIPGTYGGVTIKGKPGQDILQVADPSVNASNGYVGSWLLQDLNLILDDSSAGSFPHRWPGRSVDDMAATAGSAVVTSPHAFFSCGDKGQAIQINGAGANGANLVTTIASVYPCWTENNPGIGNGWQRVTLSTNASTTVTNAHAYISVAGLPVTATIGAAAIAMDDKDANTANWPTPLSSTGGSYVVLRNVNFSTTSTAIGGQNNTAAIFTQGQAVLYGLRADHVNAQRFVYGVVQSCSELNSYFASCSGDYQLWQHMNLNGITFPWIEYNGLMNHYVDIQLYSANGPQFLQQANQYSDTFGGAMFENSALENGGMSGSVVGWRIEGSSITLNNVSLGNGNPTYLDTDGALGTASWGSALYINGNGNRIRGGGGPVFDGGRNNQVITSYPSSSLPFSATINTDSTAIPTRGALAAGRYTPDFLKDGNTTPYNLDDLMLWPKDFIFQGYSGPYAGYYTDDSTSPSGGYLSINNMTATLNQFSQFFVPGNANGYITPGVNIPVGGTTAYVMAKCPAAGSAEIDIQGSMSGNLQIPFSCTTSWAIYSAHGSITNQGASGYLSVRNPNSGSVYLAWVFLRPDVKLTGAFN